MPKVNVVIPVYNRIDLLPECIQSVLNQSFRDFDVTVVDDGSEENIYEVVSAFPVTYFRQENQGPGAAYNKGAELTSGEYIVFLDSDDALLENALEIGVKTLDKYPDAGFSYGEAYLIDEKGRTFGLTRGRPDHTCAREGRQEIEEMLIFGNPVPCSAVMIRRSCFEDVGRYNPTFRSSCDDFDLWIRLAKRYEVVYIAEPLAKYRFHNLQLSHTCDIEEIEKSKTRVIESVFNDPELGHTFTHLRRDADFQKYIYMASRANELGQNQMARDYLFKARKTYPEFFNRNLRQYIFLYMKSLLPPRFFGITKQFKRYLQSLTIPYALTKS